MTRHVLSLHHLIHWVTLPNGIPYHPRGRRFRFHFTLGRAETICSQIEWSQLGAVIAGLRTPIPSNPYLSQTLWSRRQYGAIIVFKTSCNWFIHRSEYQTRIKNWNITRVFENNTHVISQGVCEHYILCKRSVPKVLRSVRPRVVGVISQKLLVKVV